MKKKTAKLYGIILAISYILLITGGVVLVIAQRNHSSEAELSEATASDNVSLGEVSGEIIEEVEQVVEEHKDTTLKDNTSLENDKPIDSSASTEQEVEEGDNKGIRMLFTGDVYIGNYVSSVYQSKGVQGVVSEHILEQLTSADFTMVNQEFPFSTRGEPMEDKQYTFRVNPEKVSLFHELGIDLVSLANNHTLDYGIDALLDTLDTLNVAGIPYVGAGANIQEAKATRYFEVQGKKLAVLSASRVIPVSSWAATSSKAGLFTTYDPTALIEEIKIARESADIVLVYVHWGLEHKEYPEDYQRIMGREFIDAGADVVIGSHPHVLQGFEYYKDGFIAYSLGNFIFSETIDRTAILALEIDENNEFMYSVIPCSTTSGKTSELVEDIDKVGVYDYLSSISEGATINEMGYIEKTVQE